MRTNFCLRHSSTILLASVVVLGLPFLVAHAFADSVDVSPNSAVGNTPITVMATGFDETGNMAVFFYLDTPGGFEQPGYWGVCFGSGSCQIQTRMPFGAGSHTVYAYGYANAFAQTQFTVLTPVLMLDHACLTNGTPLIVTGYNFAQGANINLYLDGDASNGGTFLGQGHTDSAGGFVKELNIGLPSGPHTITAYNGTGVIAGSQGFVVGSNHCPQAGRGVNVAPDAKFTHPGGQPQKFNPNDPVQPGDLVETGQNPVLLLFPDGTTMTLGPNAKLIVDEYVYDANNSAGDQGHYNFLRGAFEYTSGQIGHDGDKLHVHVPAGVLGIRGTKFIARRDPCSTTQEVYLINGQLAVTPADTDVTNIVNAPVTLLFDASTVTTSALTQATYDALAAQVSQTNNPATFASWQIHYFDCTNNNPSAAGNADPDGDGQVNTNEFLTGTDPTDSTSAFRILNITRTNANIKVTWFTHAGITNVVQATTDLAGSYTNVSANLIIAGTTNSDDVVTNYVDIAAGSLTSRFYRVRLVP